MKSLVDRIAGIRRKAETWPTCPICGAHTPPDILGSFGSCEYCQEKKPAKEPTIDDRLRAAGVPPLYVGFRDGDAKLPAQMDGFAEAAGGRLSILTIWGPTGAGKTWLAVQYAARSLGAGGSVYWLPDRDLYDTRQYPSVTGLVRRRSVLIFDDAGASVGGPEDWRTRRLESLVLGRVEMMLPLVITTNISPTKWVSLSPRVARRMADGFMIRMRERTT